MLEVFEAHFMPEPMSGCWLWLGAINSPGGYGQFVSYTQSREIGVWAKDEDEACEKAESIVANWDNVTHAEADFAEEE